MTYKVRTAEARALIGAPHEGPTFIDPVVVATFDLPGPSNEPRSVQIMFPAEHAEAVASLLSPDAKRALEMAL
jgi:hypothetical protein